MVSQLVLKGFNFVRRCPIVTETTGKLLCQRSQGIGLRYASLNADTASISKMAISGNPTLSALLDMGIKESDAKILVKTMPGKELLERCNLYKEYNNLDNYVEITLGEYNELCQIYGRHLDFSKANTLDYITTNDIGTVEVMDLTRKHRALRDYTEGKIENIPEDLIMTEEDKIAKAMVDKHFKSIKGSEYDAMLYRGEVIERDLPYVQKLENLQEGEVFEMPGYAWVTDSRKYAFGVYGGAGAADIGFFKIFNRMRIEYHILCPKNTKLKASRPREGQEYVMPCDSKVKLIKKIIDEENRRIIIYCEHIPS